MNWEYAICMVIGAIVGCIFMKAYLTKGVLQIDKNDPEKDIYRLCINELENLERKKYIMLKIDKYANVTRK